MKNNFKSIMQNYNNSLDRDFSFVQLGCNDGKMADPIFELIYENGWNNGLFVDADIHYLREAQALYNHTCPGRDFTFANVGMVTFSDREIQNTNLRKFFSINPDVLIPKLVQHGDDYFWVYGTEPIKLTNNPLLELMPGFSVDVINSPLNYLQGVGSFDYDFVLDHFRNIISKGINEDGRPDISAYIARNLFTEDTLEHRKYIKMQIVPVMTLNEILCFKEFENIDLLQTDLETWDVKILADLDKFSHKPKFIHFEAPGAHGGVDKSLRSKFKECGYSLNKMNDTRDYLAELL